MTLSTAPSLAGRGLFRWPGPLVDWWSLLALPVAAPVAYLAWVALTEAPLSEVLDSLRRSNVPFLVWQSAAVALGATIWAWVLALPWAWLATRTDVPGRGLFRLLAPLPLAVPPYVGALVYAALLAPGGAVHVWLSSRLGTPVGATPFPDLFYSPLGAAFILGLFTAPHLTVTVSAALERTNPAFEEAARGLGHGGRSVFWHVTLPLLRPSLIAGSLLVFVYGWVDFGVVSLLRVRTFTTAIYNQLLAGFSLPASAALSLLLVAFAGLVLLVQRQALGAARYVQADVRSQQPGRVALRGVQRWAALAYLAAVVAVTLAIPLVALGWHAAQLGATAGSFLLEQASYLLNSVTVAAISATVVLALGCIYGWLRWSGSGRGGLGVVLLQVGYGAPGTVLGLGLVGLTLATLPAVYGTPLVLVAAYTSLFAAPAVQGVSAALTQVPRSYAEAARVLGRGPVAAFSGVVAPLVTPGLLGTWLLVFALSIRELAATIILRPPGFDTLAVRIWVHTMDVGPDPRASAAALLLTLVTGAAWLLALRVLARRAAPTITVAGSAT